MICVVEISGQTHSLQSEISQHFTHNDIARILRKPLPGQTLDSKASIHNSRRAFRPFSDFVTDFCSDAQMLHVNILLSFSRKNGKTAANE